MAKPVQPCLAHPIPTSSSQIVITYKHTYFDENASDLENYPYFASPSNRGQPQTRSIHFVEFRCVSAPPSDIGHPGDVWIDLTPNMFGIYAKVDGDWRKWPGLLTQDDSLIAHPHIPSRVLWCTKHRVTWLKRNFLLSDLATHRAEMSNDEAALDAQSVSKTIGRMLMNEAQCTPKKLDGLGDLAGSRQDAPVRSKTSDAHTSSPAATFSMSPISHSKNRPSIPTIRTSRNSWPRSSLNNSKTISSVPDPRDNQHLLDQMSNLKDENRRLSEEVVSLREENVHRRSKGPFRDMVLAAVGEAAFSEELLDLAKDAAISQLTKTVADLSHELHIVRTSQLEAITNLSEKLNVTEASRLRLQKTLMEFHEQVIDSQDKGSAMDIFEERMNSHPDNFLPTTSSGPFAHNNGSNSNTPRLCSSQTTRQSSTASNSPKSPIQLETAPPSIPTNHERMQSPSPKLNPRSSSTVADSTAVINLSKYLTPPLPSIAPQSIIVEYNADSDESSLDDVEFVLETHSESPPAQAPSSTIQNHLIENAATQTSRKRRLSEGDTTTAAHHFKIACRTADGKFRKASPESTPSTADAEIGSPTDSSTSIGDDEEVGKTLKEELAELRLLGRNQSSKYPLHRGNDERHLLRPDHLDKLYTLDTDRYFCHACFIRSDKAVGHSHKPPSFSFPKTVLSRVLINHYEKEHAETCKKFLDLWSRTEM